MELCPCGKPLHYADEISAKIMEKLIEKNGPEILVTTPRGTWKLPRHFIALHGIKAKELPVVAQRYGFEKVA